VLLQATLNGDLTKAAHPGLPVSIEELARDAAACVAAGARAIHLHPRDSEGRERLDAEVVDEVVVKVRDACGAPVGVSTGAWIEPDLERRLELVQAWRAADYASVNVSEPGAAEIMQALIQAGIGIEAGVWTVEDAERLAASGLGGQVTRILVEPVEVNAADAVELVKDIHRALDGFGLTAPRLQPVTERPHGVSSPMRFTEASTPGSALRTRSTSRTASEPQATRHSVAPPATWAPAPTRFVSAPALTRSAESAARCVLQAGSGGSSRY
jgi:hypothetical protein